MSESLIGIIGGSGLYQMEGVKTIEEKRVPTPFGEPSDAFILSELEGRRFVFLPRHGRGHRVPPHQINYRANIHAMKELGVDRILSVSAVGSMKEKLHPGEFVVVDQFIDRTKMRKDTFFEDGIVAHVAFADPVCPVLKREAVKACKVAGAAVHEGGTYVCIEGPMFSSRAESNVYRGWGVDVIGMTNYQEAKLAREAEICYATIALVTDYDCWHEEEGAVDTSMVLATLQKNVAMAQKTVRELFKSGDFSGDCGCGSALANSIMTSPDGVSPEARRRLALIAGKYLK
ncbi:MAG TPA: S-methyl-5'-thioadenosine phosphorylase [bacterium]|nr:MAG: S-methyl-5'-thioadenosine phosphorylase [bacterium ADurb.Bin270]HPW45227.1 S-methyl-5'-thioadenosine phosphorylase [bacterium]HQC50720.1 S-methyl-5'-thioadenosine phosphorylase [bacterium]